MSKRVKATKQNEKGQTVHFCQECGREFLGTQKRGRPHSRCLKCRKGE